MQWLDNICRCIWQTFAVVGQPWLHCTRVFLLALDQQAALSPAFAPAAHHKTQTIQQIMCASTTSFIYSSIARHSKVLLLCACYAGMLWPAHPAGWACTTQNSQQ
jgi:hypothetical protein